MFSICLIPELASSFNFQPGFSGSLTDLYILWEETSPEKKNMCDSLRGLNDIVLWFRIIMFEGCDPTHPVHLTSLSLST